MGMFTKKKNIPSPVQIDPKVRSEQLLNEYNRIFKSFRTHPHISVKEVFGTPPEKYHIAYHVDGLAQIAKSLESISEHVVEIMLPPGYPNEPPRCKPITPLYHPNITADSIDITHLMTPGLFLADLIVRIGQMIVFQRFSTDDAINADACQWALRNKSILPLSTIDLNYTHSQEAPDTVLTADFDKEEIAPEATPIPKIAPVAATITKDPPTTILRSLKKTETSFKPDDLVPTNVNCPFCGNKNILKANFCFHCGKKLNKANPVGKKKARPLFLAGLIAFPLLIIIAGIVAVYYTHDTPDAPEAVPTETSPAPVNPAENSPQKQVQQAAPEPQSGKTDEQAQSAAERKPKNTSESKPIVEYSPVQNKSVKEIKAPDKTLNADELSKQYEELETAPEPARAKPQPPKKNSEKSEMQTPTKHSNPPAHPITEQQKQDKITTSLKLARLYVGIGSYDDAIAQYLDALMIDPTNQEARNELVKTRETKKALLGK